MCAFCVQVQILPMKVKSPLLRIPHTEAESHLSANSGCNQIGFPLCIQESTWNQHFSMLIIPHVLNQVGASHLCFSQVNEHFA